MAAPSEPPRVDRVSRVMLEVLVGRLMRQAIDARQAIDVDAVLALALATLRLCQHRN